MRQSGHKPGRFLIRPMPPDVHLGGGSLFNPMTFYTFTWGGVRDAMVARDKASADAYLARLRRVAEVAQIQACPLALAKDFNGPVVQGWIANAQRLGAIGASGLGAVQF